MFGGIFESVEIGRLAGAREALSNASECELEDAVMAGHTFASEQERAGVSCGRWERLLAPDVFYKGIAAVQILTQRQGRERVWDILGYRPPETLREKIKYWLSDELPKKD